MSTSLLVTAQHSEPYRKIGRMHVLYNFSFSLDYSNTNIIIIRGITSTTSERTTTKTDRVFWNELLHVVIKAEVDHIEHSITSHRRCYALVQTSQTKAIFTYDLSCFGNSRRPLTNTTTDTALCIRSVKKINSPKILK